MIRLRPGRIVASPLGRARLTAEKMADALGLPFSVAEDLAEIDFGKFDGMTYAEIARLYPAAAKSWADDPGAFTFPDGESVPAFDARTVASWAKYADADEEALLIVTHGGVISSWTCLFLGLPLEKRHHFRPDYAAVSLFLRHKDGASWEMACFNNKV